MLRQSRPALPTTGAVRPMLERMAVVNWVTIIVACIAAIASVAGALFARSSAEAARNSADNIDRRRHRVEALDHEAESFQAAFNAFIASVTRVNGELELEDATKQVGPALAAASAVRIHPRTDEDLLASVVSVAVILTNTYYKGSPRNRHEISQKLVQAENHGRAIVLAMSQERRDLIAGLSDVAG